MKPPTRVEIAAVLIITAWLLFMPAVRANQANEAKAVDCESYSGIKSPKFRTAKKFRTDVKPGLSLFVSISSSDYSYDKILALVGRLANEHANESHLFLFVFDDYSGAKHFNPQGEGNGVIEARSFLASYVLNREVKDQSLIWRPVPAEFNRWERINLAKLPVDPRQR